MNFIFIMTIFIHGIGWLTKDGYGCIRSGLRNSYESGEGMHSLVKRGIFSHPFKNFGRLDHISKMTAYAVSLALQDAGIEYGPEQKQDIGIIGTNAAGSLQADVAYFKDYVDSGRTLSRGNLFIYTLPSSPIGETAIHFGLRGPLLYVAGRDNSFTPVLDTACEMMLAHETKVMIAGKAEDDEAVFFVIGFDKEPDSAALCGISDARSIVETTPHVSELVRKFSELAVRKA